jgi:hypothetical protein
MFFNVCMRQWLNFLDGAQTSSAPDGTGTPPPSKLAKGVTAKAKTATGAKAAEAGCKYFVIITINIV